MEQHEKETQECLGIEDSKSALSCLKKVVESYSESDVCRPRLILLVQESCDSCKQEAKVQANDIAKGIVEKVYFESPLGREIADKNDIDATPALVVVDCNNKIIEPVNV